MVVAELDVALLEELVEGLQEVRRVGAHLGQVAAVEQEDVRGRLGARGLLDRTQRRLRRSGSR